MKHLLACAVALAISPGAAFADGIKIVKGNPKSAAARAALARGLERARGDLAVCLRGDRPAEVRVELEIAANGGVTRSASKSAGSVGQCIAGVLAVQTLEGAGPATVVAEIPTGGGATVGGGATGGAGIEGDLQAHSATFAACHKRDPSSAGKVVMKFLVKSDGRILEPEIASATLDSDAVKSCLVDAFAGLRVSERAGAKTLSMSYTLTFAAKGSSGGGSTQDQGDSLQPQKTGPLDGAVISQVMNENKAKFSACYDRVARKQSGLAGKVVLRFTVRGDGTVRNSKIRETTLNNKAVEDCVAEVGSKLRFPAEAGRAETKVFYPFAFSQ